MVWIEPVAPWWMRVVPSSARARTKATQALSGTPEDNVILRALYIARIYW
jgi:hypothetical protein